MNDDDFIRKVKTVCQKKPLERTSFDLQELQDLTRNTKIFKNLIEANGESAHLLCCRYLFYEFCPADTYLFKVGDNGTKFYIIISGKVGVEIPIRDDKTGLIHSIEVVQFSKGGSFGELALESSKPRAASIKCKQPCHFVVLEKSDYNRLILKLIRDKRNNLVSFLQSLPIFSKITKGTIAKLTYNFREKEYTQGQTVYREGERASDVYIVIEGEFLFLKKVRVDDGRKLQPFYVRPYGEESEICRVRAKALQKDMSMVGEISKLGVREMFGLEEHDKEVRRMTCICNSMKAKVLCIARSDFFKRVEGEDVFEYIEKRNKIKNEELQVRTAMWRFIAEDKAKSLSPIQMRKRENELCKELKMEPRPMKGLRKSETIRVFSKKLVAIPNKFMQKAVDAELRKIGSSLSNTKKLGTVENYNKERNAHLRSISTQRFINEKYGINAEDRPSLSPMPLKLHRFYHMNSKVLMF
jgi:CRP-like cAMP-binding protein